MIKNITIFDNINDLRALTGWTKEELYIKGFNITNLIGGVILHPSICHYSFNYLINEYEIEDENILYSTWDILNLADSVVHHVNLIEGMLYITYHYVNE